MMNNSASQVQPEGVWDSDTSVALAHLAAIIASSDDAIVSKNLNGIIQSWNGAAERIFGYTAEEAIGRPITLILPEDRLPEEEMIIARIRRGEKVDHFETIRRRKDGNFVEVSVSISPVRDSTGKIVGASKIARDITDRIAADTASGRLGAIIESSDDAIVSKNLDGIIQSWNRGAERLFGYMAEEVIGQSMLVLLPKDRQEEETRILERLRRGERVDHFDTVRIRKDGKPIHVSVTISPIRDRRGKVIGASKVARDISERKVFEATTTALTKELEQRVSERTADLEAAHREMESFTYSIAHDLRGPLRAIISTSVMLTEDYGGNLPPQAIDLLGRQINSAKRLGQLIEDLLQYSRIGKTALTIRAVDLSSLAEDITADVRYPKCTFVVQPGLLAQGDPSLLRLLVQNLIENACKFSPEGGTVEFGKMGTSFFVRDEGLGFDMAYAEKIFIPFERLVRNDEIPGTGIGLATVKRILERHGGTVWANSFPGQGSTFYFTLPDPKLGP